MPWSFAVTVYVPGLEAEQVLAEQDPPELIEKLEAPVTSPVLFPYESLAVTVYCCWLLVSMVELFGEIPIWTLAPGVTVTCLLAFGFPLKPLTLAVIVGDPAVVSL
jgi:hypothetical protein